MCLVNVKFDEWNAYTNIYLLTKGFGIVFNFVFVVTAFINSFVRFTEFLNEVIERRDSYNLDHDANFVQLEIRSGLIRSVHDCGWTLHL